MSSFSKTTEIQVRYRDIDSVKHVNNAVYVSYLEQARIEYVDEVVGQDPVEPSFVLVSLDIDYERTIRLGESVTVAMETTAIGTSSIEMGYEIRADGDRAATATSVIVPFDPETDSSYPVTDRWRERISAHEGKEF